LVLFAALDSGGMRFLQVSVSDCHSRLQGMVPTVESQCKRVAPVFRSHRQESIKFGP
jgi:hypothetical protein